MDMSDCVFFPTFKEAIKQNRLNLNPSEMNGLSTGLAILGREEHRPRAG